MSHPLLAPMIPAVKKTTMPEGTRFKPGKSGNPGGRPKGLARKVRETLGDDDGETLTKFWESCLTGRVKTIDVGGVPTWQIVEVRDRIAVSKMLAERGWGKPPAYAPIEDEDPLELSESAADEIAVEFDAKLDEIGHRRKQREADEAAARAFPDVKT